MKTLRYTILFFVIFALLPLQAWAEEYLIPVGQVIGLQLRDDTVTVAAFDDALGGCAKKAGLRIGDEIVEINGHPVSSADDVRSMLKNCSSEIAVTIRRGGKISCLHIAPQSTDIGPRLGVYLRQGIAGIGTVTWYDPASGRFAALGHGVNNASGDLINMTQGSAYHAEIFSVKKGQCGHPGQLRGNANISIPWGKLVKNTPQGIFGISGKGWQGEPVATASRQELHTGSAVIRSTICGEAPREYSVDILKIYPADRCDGRNMLLKVTDPQLLETTGGIVQGMSGSPILQDGKLVGAVTHVLVNDPTIGYGIFIGNMLDAAA